jgi:hypothetical protein
MLKYSKSNAASFGAVSKVLEQISRSKNFGPENMKTPKKVLFEQN